MSSYELLELFGVTIINPEIYTVTVYVKRVEKVMELPVDPDNPHRLLPADQKPQRVLRVDFTPEDGVLAEVLRAEQRPEWKQMLAQIANETAVLRTAQCPGVDSEDIESRMFYTPAKLRELMIDAAEQFDARESVFAFADRSEGT